MAKKNFKKGFTDLLSEAMDGNLKEKVTKKTANKKQSSTKSFALDLESLFEETIKESTAENVEAIKSGKKPVKKTRAKSKRSKPSFGLDALIRETVETSTVETKKTAKGLKRVTITLEQKRLEKLKSIARMEKSYLKDIINEVVAEYITKYETQQKPA